MAVKFSVNIEPEDPNDGADACAKFTITTHLALGDTHHNGVAATYEDAVEEVEYYIAQSGVFGPATDTTERDVMFARSRAAAVIVDDREVYRAIAAIAA